MNYFLYLLLGAIAGVLSGLFGIGGGIILIPALVFVFGLTQHQAQGTTLAILLPPIGLLAAWRYWQAGNVNVTIAWLVCLGFFFGGLIGANFAQGINDLLLKRIFGVFLAFVAVEMIIGK
ncbi:MAG: TSUP family transporter [Candidatus Omnitrophica bacterium]|nr:TSUP family transporter [Candidatus Omnitrophota bacterium]